MEITPILPTRLVPIPYKGLPGNDLFHLRSMLSRGPIKPLVIFLTHQKLEFPKEEELPIFVKVIRIPKGRLISGPEYAEFKRVVFEFLAEVPFDSSYIGVASSKGDDVCLYVIARWMIEEKNVEFRTALNEVAKQKPPGIRKSKYLNAMTEMYDDFTLEQLQVVSREQTSPHHVIRSPNVAGYGQANSAISPNYVMPSPQNRNILSQNSAISPQNSLRSPQYIQSYTASPMVINPSVTPGQQQVSSSLEVNQPINVDFNPSPTPEQSYSIITTDNKRLVPPALFECKDPILRAFGMSISPQEEGVLRTEIARMMGNKNPDCLIQPYTQLNRGSLHTIEEDKNVYCFMQQPEGKRCFLYSRGKNVYMISEPGYARLVKCFMPDHENPSQCLTSTIFDGFLCRTANSNNIYYMIGDCLIYEGENLGRVPFCQRLFYGDQTVRDFKDLIEKKLSSPQVSSNMMTIEIRKYFRLKYVQSFISKPSTVPLGYLFTPKYGGIEPGVPMLFYRNQERPMVTICVEVEEGNCYGTIEDNIRVAEFSIVTEQLRTLDGALVDIEWSTSNGHWIIKSLSQYSRVTSRQVYQYLTMNLSYGPLNDNIFSNEINKIVTLPHYLDEDAQKKDRSK